ncbi:ATP phosphoribosyltransferase regulatory subunit [Niveibacterium sp. 24ML]|uniref:ATP phosphoribosyltransferase regulatory subunit n=1 Tax=Niveibacterium sp. 24ML TaxID=2985512 RepID=UPI002271D344|nr:ATP phosphoribosyltransferase regulatory subunit [Niveibacterium sp. 24ML]MCX9155103.1 ATP phosphoribosyltransferase regulatory subunit [Niveibacterium sp. 24ML]
MPSPHWALPDHIEDALPLEAARLEAMRRRLLDEFRLHGYQLVMPPLIEYVESLLSGTGKEMGEHTFRMADPFTGRMLGLRADITPQVTRIDAHLLNRQGVARLCYAASVVRTTPRSLLASRHPMQLGAEIYGHAGIEADIEVIRLLARTLDVAGVRASRIDLGHIGLFRALAQMAGLSGEQERELFAVLQAKDVPTLKSLVDGLPAEAAKGLLALPSLYGGAEVLVRAASVLPKSAQIVDAISQLQAIADALPDLPLSFDLADLRGYDYHSGLVFAAFCASSPAAVAFGGRYDEVGRAFGRARPATGFSVNDLRDLIGVKPATALAGAILAPVLADAALESAITDLRASGEIVMRELPGHTGCWREAGCDRQLVLQGGRWTVAPLQGE